MQGKGEGEGGLVQMVGGYVEILLNLPFYEAHFFADPPSFLPTHPLKPT